LEIHDRNADGLTFVVPSGLNFEVWTTLTMVEILLVIMSLNNNRETLCRLYLVCNMNLDAERSCQLFNPAPAPLVAFFIGFTAPYSFSKRSVINSPLHPRATNCRGDQKKKRQMT
jgi:hypothetical protein